MNPRIFSRLAILALLLTISGCVYYNTFYFARHHFRNAEALRIKAEEEERVLPPQAVDLYKQSLQYSARVLRDHPDSKYNRAPQ